MPAPQPVTTENQTPAVNPPPPPADTETLPGGTDSTNQPDAADNPLGQAFGHGRSPRFAKFEQADAIGPPTVLSALPATREGIVADPASATGAGEAPMTRGPPP